MITSVDQSTYEFRGLSTDTKPTENVGNGSLFFEMDTSKWYMFDASANTWMEITWRGI